MRSLQPERAAFPTGTTPPDLSRVSALTKTYLDLLQSEPGTITIDGVQYTTEPEVIAMHKVILIMGQCYSEQLSNACRSIFLATRTACTKQEYLDALPLESSNPFVAPIVQKVRETWAR